MLGVKECFYDLWGVGICERNASGKDTQRPYLERLVALFREGHTVVMIHCMQRLARNLDKERRINILYVKMPIESGMTEYSSCAGRAQLSLIAQVCPLESCHEYQNQ